MYKLTFIVVHRSLSHLVFLCEVGRETGADKCLDGYWFSSNFVFSRDPSSSHWEKYLCRRMLTCARYSGRGCTVFQFYLLSNFQGKLTKKFQQGCRKNLIWTWDRCAKFSPLFPDNSVVYCIARATVQYPWGASLTPIILADNDYYLTLVVS